MRSDIRNFAQKQKPTQKEISANCTRHSRTYSGQSHEVSSILHSQGMIGNQAVQRLLQANDEKHENSLLPSKSSCFDHNFSRITVNNNDYANVQPKLKFSAPGDRYEQEADYVADQVIRMQEAQVQLQSEGEKDIHMKAGPIAYGFLDGVIIRVNFTSGITVIGHDIIQSYRHPAG